MHSVFVAIPLASHHAGSEAAQLSVKERNISSIGVADSMSAQPSPTARSSLWCGAHGIISAGRSNVWMRQGWVLPSRLPITTEHAEFTEANHWEFLGGLDGFGGSLKLTPRASEEAGHARASRLAIRAPRQEDLPTEV